MGRRKKLKLNLRFKDGAVECAKSSDLCGSCKEYCEKMDLFYYPFNYIDVKECFKNSEKKM